MQAREDVPARLLYSDDTSHFAPCERGIVGGACAVSLVVQP